MGTSGSATQSFVHEGKHYGHILDPRTGWPAERVYRASAVAPTAAEADAYATAFAVLGPEGTAEICRQLPQIGGLVVCAGAKAGAVDIHPFNLESDAWQPA